MHCRRARGVPWRIVTSVWMAAPLAAAPATMPGHRSFSGVPSVGSELIASTASLSSFSLIVQAGHESKCERTKVSDVSFNSSS